VSVLVVGECRSLKTLTGDERTASCALVQLKDKHNQLDQKKDWRAEDAGVYSDRKA
jgi:hypothetical protein